MRYRGGNLEAEHCYHLFRQKSADAVRSCIKEFGIDINACTIHVGAHAYTSPLVYAIVYFDQCTVACLLSEFGADLNAPCYLNPNALSDEKTEYVLDFALCGPESVAKVMEATDFLLDHGASPFLISSIEDPKHARLVPDALLLIEAAKDRLRTAWASCWALSHHPVWRDMIQPAAQRVMGTPVREFLTDEKDGKRHKK